MARDVAMLLAGAALTLAVVAPSRGPGHAPLPKVPADDPGELMAWGLSERAAERVGTPGALLPCALPVGGRLTPVLDERTRAPSRISHWLEGGPRLYLMRLDAGPERPEPRRQDAALVQDRQGMAPPGGLPAPQLGFDPARCPAGRVLVPAETIMNYLFLGASGDVRAPAGVW